MVSKQRIRSIGNLQRAIKRSLQTKKSNRKSRDKSRDKSRRKSRRRIQSSVGNILPHIDVKSKSDIPQLLKRITQGPVTIVLVYADWCGHCHTYKPTFNKAIQNKNRTVQVASINEKVLNDVNEAITKQNSNAKPITVSGFPSLETISPTNGSIKNVPQGSLERTLVEAGPLAEQSIAPKNSMEQYMDTPVEPVEPVEPVTTNQNHNANNRNHNANNRMYNANNRNHNANTMTPMSLKTTPLPAPMTSNESFIPSKEPFVTNNALPAKEPLSTNVPLSTNEQLPEKEAETTEEPSTMAYRYINKHTGGSLYKKMAQAITHDMFSMPTLRSRRRHRK